MGDSQFSRREIKIYLKLYQGHIRKGVYKGLSKIWSFDMQKLLFKSAADIVQHSAMYCGMKITCI